MQTCHRQLKRHQNQDRAGSSEKPAERDPQRALEEKQAHGNSHAQSQACADPGAKAFAGQLHGAEDQRQLCALAEYHEKDECCQPYACDSRGPPGVGFYALFNFFLQVPRDAVHPNDHGDHKEGGQQQQQALEAVLAHLPALQGQRDCEAGGHRHRHAGPDVTRELGTSSAVQINEDDADDQRGLDTFAQGDKQS